MSADAKHQPQLDDKNCWQMPYPMMGISGCENGRHLMSCGGGGAASKKEIPNEIHLHVWDTVLGKYSTVDRRNLGAVLPTNVTYSVQQDLWCVSAGAKGYVIEVKCDDDSEKMEVVHEFISEREKVNMGKNYDGTERIAEPSQEKCVLTENLLVTVGSDKIGRVWSYPDVASEPKVEFSGHEGTIEDLDINADEKWIVTTAEDRTCRIWCAQSGAQHHMFNWLAPNGQDKLSLKCPRFLGNVNILLSASGPRGPARLGVWHFVDNKKEAGRVFEATIDPKPASSMTINHEQTMLCCGFVTGNKTVFSIDITGFKSCVDPKTGESAHGPLSASPFARLQDVGTMKKPVHALPVMRVAFVAPDTVCSASGDRTVHFGPEEMKSGGKSGGGLSCSSCSCCSCIIPLLMIVVLIIGGLTVALWHVNGLSIEEIEKYQQQVESLINTRNIDIAKIMGQTKGISDVTVGNPGANTGYGINADIPMEGHGGEL